MEVAISEEIPTYSGGLGTLAGDMALSFADLGLPATFITLLSRKGYTSQKLDGGVGQLDSPDEWDWKKALVRTELTASVDLGDAAQKVGAWEYKIRGNAPVSILFLDT